MYQATEVNGFICAWLDQQGNEPNWSMSDHDVIKENKMIYRGSSLNIINCYPEVILNHYYYYYYYFKYF